MKKRTFIILGIVLVIVFFGLITLYLIGKEELKTSKTSQSPELTKCTNLTANKKDECSVKIAIEKNNSKLCEAISNSEIRDECYNRIGINTKDVSLCDKIVDTDKQQSCKAFVTKDERFCENIINSRKKNLCYGNLALFSNDVSLCDKISDKNGATLCKNLVLKSLSLCKSLEMKGQCHLYVAKFLRNKSIYKKLINSVIKD